MNKVKSNSQKEKMSFQAKAPECKLKIVSGTNVVVSIWAWDHLVLFTSTLTYNNTKTKLVAPQVHRFYSLFICLQVLCTFSFKFKSKIPLYTVIYRLYALSGALPTCSYWSVTDTLISMTEMNLWLELRQILKLVVDPQHKVNEWHAASIPTEKNTEDIQPHQHTKFKKIQSHKIWNSSHANNDWNLYSILIYIAELTS